MILTNYDGIEESLLLAIKRAQTDYGEKKAEYLKTVGDYDVELSVTTLAQSPQMYQLKKRHWDEIEKDARDLLPSLMGTLLHKIAEDHPVDGDIVEQRVGRTIRARVSGKEIKVHVHGASDKKNLARSYLKDFKFCKMVAMSYPKTTYEQQVNILRFLQPEEEKAMIKYLANVFCFTDYRPQEAKEGRSREPHWSREVYYDPWPDDRCKEVLKDRVLQHLRSTDLPDDQLPECTVDDLWYSRSGFRVTHRTKGTGEWGKNASGWAPTMEEAQELTKKKTTEFKIEPTEGKPRRCDYCDGRSFCSQNKRMFPQGEISLDSEPEPDTIE